MKNRILKNIIFSLLLLISCNSFAQLENEIIEKIKGKKYYMHYVEPGNTLYSLARKFNVSVADILKANPEVKAGLRIDQLLKIPFVKNTTRKSLPKNIKDKKYLYHTVIAGETLYGLSKKYKISAQDILVNNNDAIDGLKIGDILKLPINKIKAEQTQAALKPAVVDSLITFKAKKGQTLKEVSEQYHVDLDSLKQMNLGVKNKLKKAQILRIPKYREITDSVIYEIDTIIPLKPKDSLNIALILPFYLGMNDTLENHRKANEKEFIYGKSIIALDFYKGCRLALDSLKKMGISINLQVFDTDNDTLIIDRIINENYLANADLIIGPLFRSNFERTAAYAKQNKIEIVSPVPQSNKILLGNSFVAKVAPSTETKMKELAKYIGKNHKGDNIILLNNFEHKNMNLVDILLKNGNHNLFTLDSSYSDTLKIDSIREISFDKMKASDFMQELDSNKNNVVILPSDDQTLVSGILSQIHLLVKDYPITVYGMEKWKQWSNIDVDYLHDLQVHIPVSNYFDYSNSEAQKYLKLYRKNYFIDPNKYAILGFDVTLYFANLIRKSGANYIHTIANNPTEALSCSFYFYKTGLENGFENRNVFILKYKDYELVKAIQEN